MEVTLLAKGATNSMLIAQIFGNLQMVCLLADSPRKMEFR